jgi:hypothetical protein
VLIEERTAGAGEQHHRDVGIVGGIAQRHRCGVVELLVEGVEGFGPVQNQGADPVVVADLQGHGCNVSAGANAARST